MASSNGKVADSNDRVVLTPERSSPRKTGRIRWTVGLLVRLCIWYFLLTPFFRCPSQTTELTESSPRICKPYLIAKSYVEPHVAPYYNAHAAPYVDVARPYVHTLNEKVYTPASNIAKQGYEAYGAPALDRAQVYGQQQWDANVVPHIQTAKGKASDWYKLQVAPHVDYATATVSPYYHKVNGAYWTTLNGYILPFAAKYQPFIGKTYSSGQEILTTQVMPHAQSAWSSTLSFINYSLWPKVSSLYSENVEPQLVKIGQRLASYREGSRLRSVADEVESSAGYSSTSSSTSVKASTTVASTPSSVSETPTPSLSPTELAAQLRKKIASDLTTWKEKFASASEKGVANLEGRVVEIVDTYLASGAQSDGDKLVAALESAVEDETTAIKRHISALTESLPFVDAPEEEAAAIENLLKEIRNTAVSIRDRAHVIREWHVSFEEGLIRQVSIAVNSTLSVLDNVRDLGLQEIGMRWAWMDGVTYKDWEDYQALKEEFEDWKGKFREIGLQHARIESAKDTADDALSRGMDVAEAAAKELARLKEVGRWKIAAREISEDFSTRSEAPPPLPKPASAEEDIPAAQDEDQEVVSETEEPTADVNDTAGDTDVEVDGGSPKLDNVEKSTESQDAGESFSDDKAEPDVVSEQVSTNDDNQGNAGTSESNEGADVEFNKGFFGAAASVIPEEATDSGYDTDNLDQDEIVEAEATKLSEAVDAEVYNTAPAASQESQSIEDLLSHILGDTNTDFAEKVMARLNAMNQNAKPNQESASSPNDKVDGDAETQEQPQVADANEDQSARNGL